MKKILFIVALMIASIGFSQDTYRVTATTENAYGQNTWVDLYVKANTGVYSLYITGVYYNGSYISHYAPYGAEEGRYYVYIQNIQYFFTFR